MSAELNFFDTYILMAITEEIVPRQTFFKDRYFPTGDGDIFPIWTFASPVAESGWLSRP